MTQFLPQNHMDDLLDMMCQAGQIARDIYQSADHGVSIKSDQSPVTRADTAVEQYLTDILQAMTPHIPIVGEEATATQSDTTPTQQTATPQHEKFWVVDPIDGTRDFVNRTGAYSINVALIENGVPVLGMIYAPSYNNQMLVGGIDVGVFRYDVHTHTRHDNLACDVCPLVYDDHGKTMPVHTGQGDSQDSIDSINPLVIITSGRNDDRHTIAERLSRTPENCGYMNIGSAIKFMVLCGNQAHVYPRFAPCMEWDTASGDAILRQLGGGVRTLDGKPLTYGKPDYANPHFVAHAPAIAPSFIKWD